MSRTVSTPERHAPLPLVPDLSRTAQPARAPGQRLRASASRLGSATAAAVLLLSGMAASDGQSGTVGVVAPPADLEATGLYADFDSLAVDPAHIAFSPQYPLWTDGAGKRRWLSLPPGTAIDGSDPDDWVFPVGTRLWKEFSFDGRPVETRYLERLADGEWLYAAYEWSEDGNAATLVSERGRRGVYPLGGGRTHSIPSVTDCKVCHAAGRSQVLGFSALQLSPDRDPGAIEEASGIDLADLVERGLLVNFPEEMLETPPRIAAASATERSALGYLHGNCGHCHNEGARLQNLELFLRYNSGAPHAALATTVGQPIRKLAPGQPPESALRIEPAAPERSGMVQRMSSRYAALQMPPLGTELADERALALIETWIAGMASPEVQLSQEGESQ